MSNNSYFRLAFLMKTSDLSEPRKRPSQARSAATVAAMLEATARIIETQGLDALTTNRVAELAGVSIGSLYQYFPSKEALLIELIRQERRMLVQEIHEVTESVTDFFLNNRKLHLCRAETPVQASGPFLCAGVCADITADTSRG